MTSATSRGTGRPASPGTIVVVGGGLAGATAAGTLREDGYSGGLTIVGAETHPPYERPPLSKGYLHGDGSLTDAFVHPVDFYAARDIELRLGASATALDLDDHTVTVGTETIGYDRLLLATGSSARRLPAADRSGAPVAYLRTVEDADRLRAGLRPGRRIVIVGGGWIGLEVAAAARDAGCDVVVVEPLAEPLLRVLGPTLGDLFARLHRSHGVDVRTSTTVTAIDGPTGPGRTGPEGTGPEGTGPEGTGPERTGPEGTGPARTMPGAPPGDDDAAATVHLDDGTTVVADLLVVGIGATPNTGLAAAAGLEVDNGVLADEYLRTSHPDVFVAGDLANASHPRLGHTLRVEHWENARAQGATAARNLLGADEPYDRLPYFFTDQYDLGMEYVGHVGAAGYDELVLRGTPADGAFTAFWVRRGRVLAAMHANDWDAAAPMRALVYAGTADRADGGARPGVDLTALRDPRVPLEHLVP